MRMTISAVVLSLSVAACGSDTSARPRATTTTPAPTSTTLSRADDYVTALARWKALGIRDYSFHFSEGCFCPNRRGVITVRDGLVVDWQAAEDDGSAHLPARVEFSRLPTIDSLLADAGRAERTASGDIHIKYDPDTGVPTWASIDWIKNAIDDEYSWTITDFTAAK